VGSFGPRVFVSLQLSLIFKSKQVLGGHPENPDILTGYHSVHHF
jgi:hypothetical protein